MIFCNFAVPFTKSGKKNDNKYSDKHHHSTRAELRF